MGQRGYQHSTQEHHRCSKHQLTCMHSELTVAICMQAFVSVREFVSVCVCVYRYARESFSTIILLYSSKAVNISQVYLLSHLSQKNPAAFAFPISLPDLSPIHHSLEHLKIMCCHIINMAITRLSRNTHSHGTYTISTQSMNHTRNY